MKMKNSQIKINLKAVLRKEPEIFSETFFQIFTLITSIFAFAFLVAAASPAAVAESQVCCEKLKGKDIFCQNSVLSNCDANYSHAQTSCASTDYCKPGCCYDSKEGTCAQNTPRKVCALSNGTWDSNGNCNIPQCQMGCCVLGDQASLTTLVRCKKLASYYGLETDYRSAVTSEADCVAIAQASDKGACIITTGVETTCKLTSRADCKGLTHNDTAFNKGFLCSAEQLGTPCTRQARTGCLDGKDEVYWFDSCGNPENIYDADKTRSWNSGKILDKSLSCNPDKGNAEDLLCGNCNYYHGSMCGEARQGIEPKPAYGDYICRDLNCYNTYNGKDYKHGESWCVYDGEDNNPVGSRHWRHLCVMGEEKVEPCNDYRQEVCVEGTIDVAEKKGNISTGKVTKFSQSQCTPNRWRECLDYNSKSNPQDLCNKNKNCLFYSSQEDKMCLPLIPPGFDLNEGGGGQSASSTCSMGSSSCIVVYKKGWGSWSCVKNCYCKEKEWVNKANQKCTSIGDCGFKANIGGTFTKEGYSTSNNNNNPPSEASGGGNNNMMLLVGGGLLLYFVMQSGSAAGAAAGAGLWAGSLGAGGSLASAVPVSSLAPATHSIWASGSGLTALVSVAAAAIGSYFIAKMFGLSSEGTTVVVAAGTVVALATSFSSVMSVMPFNAMITSMFGMFAATVYGLIVAVIAAIVMSIIGLGKTRTETVTFTCLPWQPPSGGADCEKCNKPPIGGEMRPCSQYRCDSLGAACSLLNEGTGNETCTWLNKDDVNAPTITPWQEVLTKDHSYNDINPCPPGPGCWKITRQGAADGCIKAFTPLQFGITTNEPAQCRVETNHTSKFDDMQYFFGDNLYMYNHSIQMSLPSPAHLNYLSESPELVNDGNYKLYIRCRDANGNWNLGEMAVEFCVDPGPDTTPPVIMRTGIINGAPVAAGTTSTPLDIFLNEPSECKLSGNDEDYENMKNNFTCALNVDEMELDITYKCSANLSNIKDSATNTFYFRCKDQPWLTGKNESDRNVNKESYVFQLEGTSPLEITSTGPSGIVYGGAESIPVTITAETKGGYSNGDSMCYFSESDDDSGILFFTTGTNHHEQNLELAPSNYTIYILCRDIAGNTDKKELTISVELDKNPPIVVKAYQDAGMLKVITDEESECKYGIKDCSFDFLTGTEMPFVNSTEHIVEWRTDITYYIKCRDNYGNMPVPSECSMKINVYDVE